MKQSNLLNAQFARRLFRTAFSSWQLLAVMLIVCMNVAVGSKLYAQSNTIAVKMCIRDRYYSAGICWCGCRNVAYREDIQLCGYRRYIGVDRYDY